MQRLTERDNRGRVFFRHGNKSGLQIYAEYPPHECAESINRLAEYEDTELTPEEIHKLNNFEKSQMAILLKQNAELRQKCDYWHREAKKWANELGEGRIGPLLYMDEGSKNE